MSKKLVAFIMTIVLAAGLTPAAAFANDGAGLIAGAAAETLNVQATSAGTSTSKGKVSLSKCKVKLAKKAYKYTGKKIKPKVTVKYAGKKLKNGKDYKIVYKNANGKKVSAPKAIGVYKVIVKGKGSFKGQVVKKIRVKAPRTNPASIDASHSKTVSLTGTIVRKDETTADTMMGWGAATFLLMLPEPVTLTYDSMWGVATDKTSVVHVDSIEFYTASGDSRQVYLANHPWEEACDYDAYVGKQVKVTGKLFNTGNAHTRAICRFTAPSIEIL